MSRIQNLVDLYLLVRWLCSLRKFRTRRISFEQFASLLFFEDFHVFYWLELVGLGSGCFIHELCWSWEEKFVFGRVVLEFQLVIMSLNLRCAEDVSVRLNGLRAGELSLLIAKREVLNVFVYVTIIEIDVPHILLFVCSCFRDRWPPFQKVLIDAFL